MVSLRTKKIISIASLILTIIVLWILLFLDQFYDTIVYKDVLLIILLLFLPVISICATYYLLQVGDIYNDDLLDSPFVSPLLD